MLIKQIYANIFFDKCKKSEIVLDFVQENHSKTIVKIYKILFVWNTWDGVDALDDPFALFVSLTLSSVVAGLVCCGGFICLVVNYRFYKLVGVVSMLIVNKNK